jgi:hypothetical protein
MWVSFSDNLGSRNPNLIKILDQAPRGQVKDLTLYKKENLGQSRGQRFVTNHCKDIGICTVFCYEGEGGV